MARKRILIVHPRVTDRGGGNGVAAWTLQALRGLGDVSLATLQTIDFAAVNTSWGTSLGPSDFRLHVVPPLQQQMLRYFPTPGALLEASLTTRLARNLDREHRYDVMFSTQNEADFGRRGIQYVHYPWVYLPRPDNELRWFHVSAAVIGYRYVCQRVAQGTNEGLRRNVSLANSRFVADRIREVHGTEALVVPPPVTGDFPDVPWEQRERAMIAVGRMHGCKRWEMAVAIVDEVRRRGHELGLTLVGHVDDREYQQRLEGLAATRPWFRIRNDVTRDELVREMASHRYGIHTMENEHFGMGPAEILRAGCLLFAHNTGGPVEILDGEGRLLFDDVTSAADRIARVLADPAEEQSLRQRLARQREVFTTEAFCRSVQQIVEQFPPPESVS